MVNKGEMRLNDLSTIIASVFTHTLTGFVNDGTTKENAEANAWFTPFGRCG